MAAHCDDGKGKKEKNESEALENKMRHAFINTAAHTAAGSQSNARAVAFIGATVGVTSRESDASRDGAQ